MLFITATHINYEQLPDRCISPFTNECQDESKETEEKSSRALTVRKLKIYPLAMYSQALNRNKIRRGRTLQLVVVFC